MKEWDHVIVTGKKDSHGINEPAYIAKIMDIDAFHCVVKIIKCLNGYVRTTPSIELFPRKFIKPLNYLKMYENRR